MDFNWLWVVPVLGVLIIVHELGHFLTALWLGIKVEEFGLGFPPRAFAIRRKGIDYSLNWLPIGGFVKIVGENGDSDDPASFGRAPAWKRIIVLAAGSFMNLLLAVIIFAGMSIAGTREIDAPFTGVASVLDGQPADKAGIQPGDRIVSVNGQIIGLDTDVRALSKENQGKSTIYEIEREGRILKLDITPNVDPADGAYLGVSLTHWVSPAKVETVQAGSLADKIGLKPGDVLVEINGTKVTNLPQATVLFGKRDIPHQVVVERGGERVGPMTLDATENQSASNPFGFTLYRPIKTVYYNPVDALGRSISSTWDVISSIPRGISLALSGGVQGPGVTGPVGIGQLTGEVAQLGGINGLLNLTALLGISLFMINLLPLPALDGGRLLFIFIELLRGGRRIAPEKEGMVHVAGMVVLLALMAIITVFDVARLFEGKPLLP
ncbi:MAG TPA: site-2 protease family protein [Chloroflexia bacterium]|nr:site-2 protease family protein [Chloroflexia bacterium]